MPLFRLMRDFERIYPMSTAPEYEPADSTSIASLARARGVSAEECAYDLLLENDGATLLYLPFANYADRNLDAALNMISEPSTVIGLGDGGAHYGLICDASYPTTMLAHWTRDREGEKISLAFAIKSLCADTAELVGLRDRGRLEVGLKADINLIDHAAIKLNAPRVVFDLPGGGKRLMQYADGYRATIVSGKVIRRDGVDTGERPGRLVRSTRAKSVAA